MDKPKPKTEVAIDVVIQALRLINFYATTDAIEDFRGFGTIYYRSNNQYNLYVDPRFDFDEVKQYIENYGKEK